MRCCMYLIVKWYCAVPPSPLNFIVKIAYLFSVCAIAIAYFFSVCVKTSFVWSVVAVTPSQMFWWLSVVKYKLGSGCTSYAIRLYNYSLSATRVTTQWLKQLDPLLQYAQEKIVATIVTPLWASVVNWLILSQNFIGKTAGTLLNIIFQMDWLLSIKLTYFKLTSVL